MSWTTRLSAPLDARQAARVRIHLALLPAYGWLFFAWTMYALDMNSRGMLDRAGHIKGHDFAHFYVLGQIGAERATSDLYNYDAQAARMDQLVPQYENRFLPLHPPQVALFFGVLGRFPYLKSLAIWLLFSAAAYGACVYSIWRTRSAVATMGWWPIVVLAAGFPPFQSVIAAGQTSVLALLCFTVGWLALRRRRRFLAGLALGALAYKPSFCFVMPLAFLAAREWRLVAGLAVGCALEFAAAAAWFGPAALKTFLQNAWSVLGQTSLLEPQPWQMHSLRTFFSLLIPLPTVAFIAYALSAVIVIAIAVRVWRSSAALNLRFAILVFSTVLVDPHVNSYDLVVVSSAMLLVGVWLMGSDRVDRTVLALMGAYYCVPVFEAVARGTNIQLSVPLLALLIVLLTRAAISPENSATT